MSTLYQEELTILSFPTACTNGNYRTISQLAMDCCAAYNFTNDGSINAALDWCIVFGESSTSQALCAACHSSYGAVPSQCQDQIQWCESKAASYPLLGRICSNFSGLFGKIQKLWIEYAVFIWKLTLFIHLLFRCTECCDQFGYLQVRILMLLGTFLFVKYHYLYKWNSPLPVDNPLNSYGLCTLHKMPTTLDHEVAILF